MMTLYQVCSSCHDLSKNMAAKGLAYFVAISILKHIKNLFVRNPMDRFQYNLQKCSLGDPLSRLFKPL